MTAANIFRVAISSFIVVLIFVAGSGWLWTGSHQSAAQSVASRGRADAVSCSRSRGAEDAVANEAARTGPEI